MLFVVPIALLAISDGARGGAVGAAVATALLATWVVTRRRPPQRPRLGSRVAAFVVIGLLVGHYAELARRYERRRLDERYARELHDRVVQSLVVARYQLGDESEAAAAVDVALTGAKEIISERLGEVEPGDLRLSGR